MDHGAFLGPLADTQSHTYFEFVRLQELTDWWQWMLLLVVGLALMAYVGWLYRRDTRELRRGVRWVLLLLRITAFGGLLIFFLDLQKRTEQQQTRDSRVAVLVDTSQSMGLTDTPTGARASRLQQVIDEFSQGPLLAELCQKHEVTVYRFDQAAAPTRIATFAKRRSQTPETSGDQRAARQAALQEVRRLFGGAAAVATFGLLAFAAQGLWGGRLRGREGEAYPLLAGAVALIVALVIAAVANLRHPELAWAEIRSGTIAEAGSAPDSDGNAGATEALAAPSARDASQGPERSPASVAIELNPAEVPWNTELVARGVETRLGESLRWILDKERDGPLAGLIVLTDGQHNAGATPESVIKVAQAAEVPIYPIGMGSEKQPRNVRLVDLEAPPRVYPGDRFNLTGYLQADGLSGRTVRVRLTQRTLDDKPMDPPVELDRRVTLGEDGQIQPIQFELLPDSIGRHRWTMQIEASEADDLDLRDNQKSSTVQVVERRSRVLLFAGGPMRDYRFLRNLLYRDATTQVDVLLQTAPPGAAQEASEVLLEFPRDRDQMFQYDSVVAFDPDWTQLTSEQIQLLDEWVAEKAGGLIVVAGPVNTALWSRGASGTGDDQKLSLVRDLYPVTFYRRGAATIQLGRVGSDTPWPLRFTEEGQRAQFLWLEDSPTGSESAWSSFPGVYGYQALRGAKPGAQVYARFSDPQAAAGDELPIYMAGQFYGAGRVFYLGSGEMWRLNALDPRYFETLYTKLLRHVSQGRLLRDSSRGLLLVDQERCSLGDTITVRATLSDTQFRPLTLESVEAAVLRPDTRREPLTMQRVVNGERPGMYAAQFTATLEGDYRIELPIPGSDTELLTREVKVRVPALEIESPQRNDAVLSLLAKQTAGGYFVGLSAARGDGGVAPLPNQLRVKDQVTFRPAAPDSTFDQQLMTWLLALICGALSLEWLIRRLFKLA